MRTKNYANFLKKELRDPEVAAEYLSTALRDGSTEQFLIALRNVAQAHGGISHLSRIVELNRQSMYKTLSEGGNPTLETLLAVLQAIGVTLSFAPRSRRAA